MARRASRTHDTGQEISFLDYLMSYGWALIAIGLVVYVLFELGFFTGSTFAARALPGSCSIATFPHGWEEFITMQGDCNNELPQSVASFGGASGNSFIVGTPGPSFPVENGTFSLFAWINTRGIGQETIFSFGGTAPGTGFAFRVNGGDVDGGLSVSDLNGSVATQLGGVNDGQWHLVGVEHQANTAQMDIFIDGVWNNYTLNSTFNFYREPSFQIGRDSVVAGFDYPFTGMMSNIQLYNITLSGAQAEALYLSGIGSSPISPSFTVGWWPLNGNGADYSINKQDGVLYNISFATNWAGSYTPPTT
jgi:hypothetical protein